MIQRFINSSKNNLFIDLFIYLIPFAIIVGQAPINLISFAISIIFIFLIIKNKIFHEFKKYFIFLFFLIFLFLCNLIFSVNPYLSFISILGLIKYYIMFLSILYCLNNIKSFKNNFSLILLMTSLFVVIDSYVQYFFLQDIFGKEILQNRLTGPFDRKVPGAYVSKLIFLSLIFFSIKKLSTKYIISILFAVLFFLILTNERSPTFMFIFALFIYIFLCNIKIYFKILLLVIIPILVFLIINYNSQLKNRFIDETKSHVTVNNYWKPHFLTAIEIFKNNKIIGSGIKTFRFECKKDEYKKIKAKHIDLRCSTHPHNFYLEVLSETGLLGALTFLFVNFFILFFLITNFFKKKIFRQDIILIFCSFVILFWPLQTTGAFFSSWNGIFYWIFYAYFFNLKKILTD